MKWIKFKMKERGRTNKTSKHKEMKFKTNGISRTDKGEEETQEDLEDPKIDHGRIIEALLLRRSQRRKRRTSL